MARRRDSNCTHGVLAALLAAVSLGAVACSGDGNGDSSRDAGPSVDPQARRMLVVSLAQRVVLPLYRDFEEEAAALEEAATSYASSLSSADRDAARQAWRDAMDVWQQAVVMQFGPAGSSAMGDDNAGGQDLGTQIYSWPQTNPCKMDQVTLDESFRDAQMLAQKRVNARGLDAVEYLLFNQSLDHKCTSRNIDETSWDSLSDQQIEQRRADYAVAAAADVHNQAQALLQAWEPDQGDFLGELQQAGQGGDVYMSAQEAFEDVVAAFVEYIEKTTKVDKLAIPAGLNPDCPSTACPSQVESPFANRSRQHVLANLRGLQKMLLGDAPGTDAPGIDDLLSDLGAGELANQLTSDTETAIMRVEAIDGTLTDAVQNDRQSVVDAHSAVSSVANVLKTELLNVLDVQLPVVETDTD